MGMGDELMALGEAKKLSLINNKPVAIIDHKGDPRVHEYWTNSPYIDSTSDIRLENNSRSRPYINYEKSTSKVLCWNEYSPTPADLDHIVKRNTIDNYIIIEPNLKPTAASINKQWKKENFTKLISILPQYRFVQLGPPSWAVPGIEIIPTPDLYILAEVMSRSTMYVGLEGGLHHLAAAFKVPAIVIYGGYISSRVTGYDSQYSFDFEGLGCGSRILCNHCTDLMNSISPIMVAEKIVEMLNA